MLQKRSILTTLLAFFVLLLAVACGGEESPSPTVSSPSQSNVAQTVRAPSAGQTSPAPVAGGLCPTAGVVMAQPGEPLAASVNGQGIPLSQYERQAQQSELALVQQGVDPNTDDGKAALKGLREQVLNQLLDDQLVEQEAKNQNISVSPNDINDRVQQIIADAGSQAKFDEYLKNNQLTVQDLCQQIRANLFGEAMMARVNQNLPIRVEQVHVAHILFAKKEDADAASLQLNNGADFAELAKQVSQDEATRDNGGDLGWFPKDVMPPEFESAAFALQPGEVSGVVSTQLGLHILKVLERDPERPLSQELIQNQRFAAFAAWLEGLRAQAKIEIMVQE
jgi:parvulin-like peptidyl-prolyl isomerase